MSPIDEGRAETPDFGDLALLLHAARPAPDPGWAAGLDERAAAGFPRGGGSSPRRRRVSGWMVPAGALASLLLVVVVVAIGNGGGSSDSVSSSGSAVSTTVEPAQGTAEPSTADSSGGTEPFLRESAPSTSYDAGGTADKIAPGTANRKVDRDAQLTLSAKPDDVRGVSDEVISITRSLDGIVASSQVTEGTDGASSSLQLTIPTRNLDAALDRMTDLADVDSLNETSVDITKPVVSAQDTLRDAEARRRELLQALGNASTEAEADALTLKIADARREIAKAEAAYERLASKARLSQLDVTVRSDPGASDSRSLGDWLDDAVSVLETVAGVLLIALVIIVPIGLVAALIAAVALRIRRRRRERALD